MPTYLELCEDVRSECGIAGVIVSVTGNTGILDKLCKWVSKASQKIQLRKTNWDFLWSEWSLTLVENVSEYPPPAGFGSFDEESFWLNSGTVDAVPLRYIGYKEWRDSYHNAILDPGDVSLVTIKPNGKLGVLPTPETGGDVMTCDYWKAPIRLTDNSQKSLIPEQFHRVIVAQAKMYVAEYKHDTGLYQSAFVEHQEVYTLLKAHSLPGNKGDIRSESTLMVIEVE